MLAKAKDELFLFAQRVRQRRTELKISQETLGARMGMELPESAKVKVSRLESATGETRITLQTLIDVARELNVSADWLLGLTNDQAGLQNASDLSADEFGALQEFRAGHIESIVDRWKKRFRKSPSNK